MIEFAQFFGWTLFGAICHWAKKNVRGQTAADLWVYIWHNKWSTFRMICGIFAGVFSVLMAGSDPHSWQTIGLLFWGGFGIDSSLNSTPEQDKISEQNR